MWSDTKNVWTISKNDVVGWVVFIFLFVVIAGLPLTASWMYSNLREDLRAGKKVLVPEYYNEHGEPVRWEIVDAE